MSGYYTTCQSPLGEQWSVVTALSYLDITKEAVQCWMIIIFIIVIIIREEDKQFTGVWGFFFSASVSGTY